jgi:hypothetical protein
MLFVDVFIALMKTIGFAILFALPGALLGLISGFFGFHKIVGIFFGILAFLSIFYVLFRSQMLKKVRKRTVIDNVDKLWGEKRTKIVSIIENILVPIGGGLGAGITCYLIGNLIH